MLADNFSPSLSTQQKLLCEKRNEESEQCNKQDEMAKLKD